MSVDLTGKRFGRLVAFAFAKGKWYCLCDCGNLALVLQGNLTRSFRVTKSCGCLQKDKVTKHGLSGHLTYGVWEAMLQRCNNPALKQYKDYGGRGIKVCERWLNFDNFAKDMLPSWKEGLEIDRIDNDGDYKPSNCRWTTHAVNQRNKRKKQNGN